MRGTCGVGMRSKEYCARMSGEPLMQRGATTLGSDTQGQTARQRRNKDNNNILSLPHCHNALCFFRSSSVRVNAVYCYNNWCWLPASKCIRLRIPEPCVNPPTSGLSRKSLKWYCIPLYSKKAANSRVKLDEDGTTSTSRFDSIIKGIQSALSCCRKKRSSENGTRHKQIMMEVSCNSPSRCAAL